MPEMMPETIPEIISRLEQRMDLKIRDVDFILNEMLSGRLPDSIIAEFLSNLADKGETDDELLWMLNKMQEFAVSLSLDGMDNAIDMCGTGGDQLCTFNISTAASFVAAAAGATVAKHGNRSSSGVSGSADVFEYFGYDLEQKSSDILGLLQRHGIAFMFAPHFHHSMRHVSAARRQLSRRTAFNLLGPLANPAGVKRQLVGVSSIEFLERIPRILGNRGAQNVMAVCSNDGMDEFSTSATNRVCHLQNHDTKTYNINAKDVGLHESKLQDIRVNSRRDAMDAFVGVLNGTAHRAMIETTALNASGGLVVGGIAKDMAEGTCMALDTINNGKAFGLLKRFVADTGDLATLKGMT